MMQMETGARPDQGIFIKLYGERNCGTHYLSRLIAANVAVPQLESVEPRAVRRAARMLRAGELVRDMYYRFTFRRNLGWKHMNPWSLDELRRMGIDPAPFRFILLTKNPYSWAVSMRRNPYHLGVGGNLTIDDLVLNPVRCRRRENMGTSSAPLIQVWCTKMRTYLDFLDSAPASLVRYEDLLRDPAAVVADVVTTLSLRRRRDTFVNVDVSAKRAGRAQGRTFDTYRQYYANEEWRKSLTPTAIAAINERLDPAVMQRLGYAVLSPGQAAAAARS